MNRLITSAIVGIVAQLAWHEMREAQDSQNSPHSQTDRKR
jgi:hypothetical protein